MSAYYKGFSISQMIDYLCRNGEMSIATLDSNNMLDQKWELAYSRNNWCKIYSGHSLFNVVYQAFKPHVKDAELDRKNKRILGNKIRELTEGDKEQIK